MIKVNELKSLQISELYDIMHIVTELIIDREDWYLNEQDIEF